ncbi:MAG: hypothetical protein KHW74_13640, partial [Veillonella sp.]|nr:hypothetical protein [Veillonella sp.]
PATESTSKEYNHNRQDNPPRIKVRRDAAPTGNYRTAFTVHKGNNIRTSEYAIVYPFSHNEEEDKLYNTTPKR